MPHLCSCWLLRELGCLRKRQRLEGCSGLFERVEHVAGRAFVWAGLQEGWQGSSGPYPQLPAADEPEHVVMSVCIQDRSCIANSFCYHMPWIQLHAG